MRLLIDERDFSWDEAWHITVKTFAYTNHTLLPEALETWPLAMFERFLPRHLEIIYEINSRFLDEVRARFPGDDDRVRRMSLIGEDGGRSIRMAYLATVGSHAINGVAAMHSELVKTTILRDFYEMWPERFFNKTNGVTPRRFIGLSNPGLRTLLDETIGDGWLVDLQKLRGLERLADDPSFQQRWTRVKRENKARLSESGRRQNRNRTRPGLDVRRSGQAHPRIQAPAPQCVAHHHALQPAQGEPRPRHRARALSFSGARPHPGTTSPS